MHTAQGVESTNRNVTVSGLADRTRSGGIVMAGFFGNEPHATVGAIMVAEVVTLLPSATVADAFGLMEEKGVRCVVVADESDKVVGIITDSDVVFRAAGRGGLSKMSIADVMTPDPYCVNPELDTNDAIRLMSEHGFRRLPVVDQDNKLVGLVSIGDIIGAFMKRLSI